MLLNNTLISIFYKTTRFGSDLKSSMIRYQVLSIIYINITLLILTFGFEFFAWLLCPSEKSFPTIGSVVTGSIISLFLLRKGKQDLAGIAVIISCHYQNLAMNIVGNAPMVAIHGLLLFPGFTYFLTQSIHVRLASLGLCGIKTIIYLLQIRDMFRVTLTEEQSTQITLYMLAMATTYLTFCVTSILQKTIETSLHEAANVNYKKSENLTKEVMQAVEAKEVFVSSLSHEVRNPLNSLNGSIDYLLNVVKNIDHLKVLKNAKLSSEILLNLVSNVLDAAKLKSEKMEVSYSEAKLEEIIKKVFVINSANLKHGHIQAQALLDRKIPKSIWIDSSRLLQIMMNLVSNAIKFTPQGGNIYVQATWLKEIDEDDQLLTTMDDSKFDQLGDFEYQNSNNSSPGSRSYRQCHSSIPLRPNHFEEFSFEEAETRTKNLSSIRLFKPKVLKDVKAYVHSESFIEPWTIYKTQAIPRPMPTEFKRRTGGPSMTWSPTNPTVQRSESGYLKIQVSDTGCGISEEDIPKLFAMFAQAKNGGKSSRNKVGGTGLGLWICKQLCQKMNGDVTVYSQVNKGTKFVLYIPVNNDKITRSLSAEIKTKSDKVRALIVDDYDFNRDLHKLLLEREGVEVTLACSGVEAIEKFMGKIEGFYDFILMDINMPEMDGFTAAKRIRELESMREKKTDIYFLSGDYYNEDEVIAGFRASGGYAQGIRCMRKPIEVEMINLLSTEYVIIDASGKIRYL